MKAVSAILFHLLFDLSRISSTLFHFAVILISMLATSTQAQQNKPSTDNLMSTGFPTSRIYVTLQEEVLPGVAVTNLASHPNIHQLLTSLGASSNLNIAYNLLNIFDGHLFRVNANSGLVSVASRLDREALCASQETQFCCNAQANLPTDLLHAIDWSDRSDSESPGQSCYLVAHVALQPKAAISNQPSTTPKTGLVYIYLRLTDINDNSPKFMSHPTTLSVSEDTPISSVLHYFQIKDPDAKPNGLSEIELTVKPAFDIKTELSGFENPFVIQTNTDGGALVLAQQLDREAISTYDLTLTAIDGDQVKSRSSRLSLRIHVTDVNDNAPEWLMANVSTRNPHTIYELTQPDRIDRLHPIKFNISVSEDTLIGSRIIWLQATDTDAGENARLQYSIDTGSPGALDASKYFSVQLSTGEVRLRSKLNYALLSRQNNGAKLELPLIVRDSPRAGRQLFAKAILIVNVLDVNDQPPSIKVTPFGASPTEGGAFPSQFSSELFGQGGLMGSLTIKENQTPGQAIASVVVSDSDSGLGGQLDCKVDNEHFNLVPEQSSMTLDYLTSPNFTPKNVIVGSGIYQLVSSAELDREQTDSYHVVITCKDHDLKRPLVSRTRVTVHVLDQNDNAPEFDTSMGYNVTCKENDPPGRLIGRLSANDRDAGINAKLRYWVASADASWIKLDPRTGDVQVSVVFDRETESKRSFIAFVADDASGSGHTASTQVNVLIADENDHSPRFTDLYFFSIEENSPSGTLVGQVTAVDEDSDDNGKIRYRLQKPTNSFDLDEVTGKLTVGFGGVVRSKAFQSPLDRERQEAYELVIVATDLGLPPRQATTSVHIGVIDVNDHAPLFVFPSPHGDGSILNYSCSQLGNQIVARIQANDSDSGRNGEVNYELINSPIGHHSRGKRRVNEVDLKTNSSQNQSRNGTESNRVSKQNPIEVINPNLETGPSPEYFDIDKYSGQLFLIHPIADCSRFVDVRLIIRASDNGDPPKSSTAMLTINILPEHLLSRIEKSSPGSSSSQSHIPSNRFRDTEGITTSGRSHQQDHVGQGHSVHSDSSTRRTRRDQHRLFRSHWSTIIGLVIAMLVIMVLLCAALIILRRRLTVDSRKYDPKDDESYTGGGGGGGDQDKRYMAVDNRNNNNTIRSSSSVFFKQPNTNLLHALDNETGNAKDSLHRLTYSPPLFQPTSAMNSPLLTSSTTFQGHDRQPIGNRQLENEECSRTNRQFCTLLPYHQNTTSNPNRELYYTTSVTSSNDNQILFQPDHGYGVVDKVGNQTRQCQCRYAKNARQTHYHKSLPPLYIPITTPAQPPVGTVSTRHGCMSDWHQPPRYQLPQYDLGGSNSVPDRCCSTNDQFAGETGNDELTRIQSDDHCHPAPRQRQISKSGITADSDGSPPLNLDAMELVPVDNTELRHHQHNRIDQSTTSDSPDCCTPTRDTNHRKSQIDHCSSKYRKKQLKLHQKPSVGAAEIGASFV